jgi:hypothetical protein
MFADLSRMDIAVIIGILGSIGLVLLGRTLAPRRELLVYGIGLGVTAVAYVAFALHHGAPARYLGLELVGAVIYGSAAVFGTRRWPMLMALGWTAHVVWDLLLHPASGPAYAPVWYPWFCVGFDLPIGGYIAGLVAMTPRSQP